jgi:hypothetical protein
MTKKNGDQRRKKQKNILKLLEEVCDVKIVIMKDTLQKNVNYQRNFVIYANRMIIILINVLAKRCLEDIL